MWYPLKCQNIDIHLSNQSTGDELCDLSFGYLGLVPQRGTGVLPKIFIAAGPVLIFVGLIGRHGTVVRRGFGYMQSAFLSYT